MDLSILPEGRTDEPGFSFFAGRSLSAGVSSR